MAEPPAFEEALPTRLGAALFLVKAAAFRMRRLVTEAMRERPGRFAKAAIPGAEVIGESRSALYPAELAAEFMLQAGKVENLRLAAQRLDGVVIPDGEVFSFWAHVGRPTRRRGFVAGRELREGCIVPSIGGGLCQLSNALYDAALQAGCEIVERHAHSRQVPGSMAALGRDATVFWNYVDLRFRPAADCRLEVWLGRRELLVRLCAVAPVRAEKRHAPAIPSPSPAIESCETCGVADCFRHAERPRDAAGITAWLVDGWWPEFDEYLLQHRAGGDCLFIPIRNSMSNRAMRNYQWNAAGFARVRQAPLQVLWRSWQSRRLAAQGAERQRALLHFDERLAERYRRGLPIAATHLVVTQTLLPHLWRTGALGGRTFDVLMTRLPVTALQAALDRAAASHPQSRTLVDFRAPPDLAAAETEALAEARHWITPHSVIARLAGARAIRLAWKLPPAPSHRATPGGDLLFPATTLARKGAWELAEAARALGLRVRLAGPVLEDCWRGVETLPASAGWEGIGAVALPAWVEHQPRRLLAAVAAGVPVIASEACGLAGVPGVLTVPDGDAAALTEALRHALAPRQTAVALSPSEQNHSPAHSPTGERRSVDLNC